MCECSKLRAQVEAMRQENDRLWEITQARGLAVPRPVSKRDARHHELILGVK